MERKWLALALVGLALIIIGGTGLGIKHSTTASQGSKGEPDDWNANHVIDGTITPDTDDSYDLGSSSAEFKDLYIDGTANIDALNALGNSQTRGVTMVWVADPSTALALLNKNSDTTWADLDLTSYTSANAKMALIQVRIQVDTVQDGAYIQVELRKNGETPTNHPIFRINNGEELATYNFYQQLMVGLDSGQVCEYQITSDDWTNGQADFSFVVLAYLE